jgi:hypothetical protein
MNRLSVLLTAALLSAFVAALRADAHACSHAGPIVHQVDPSLQASDQVPPVLPASIPFQVYRGTQSGACSGSSCDGIGVISIAADATDNTTPPERIGYRLSLATGTLPSGLILSPDAIEPPGSDARLELLWDSRVGGGDEPIDFTLRVVAIDSAGNQSGPETVHVQDDPGGGCAIARGGAGRRPLAWLALAALLLAARRRPRRRR